MTMTPANRIVRIVAPSHGGLGLGFFLGGGWYRTRFDLDLGITTSPYHTGMDGRAPRVAVPLAASLLGFLAVVAASQPEQPLRETRRLELADLIRDEDARVERLRAQVGALERSLEELAQAP